MTAKGVFQVVLVASVVALAVGVGPGAAGTARALPPALAGAVAQPGPAEATIPYSGRLTDDAWQPVADGAYDFAFALYEAAEGGTSLWSETQAGVVVQGGAFTAALGSVSPLPAALQGRGLWLEVGVQGPEEAGFTLLSPRQALSAASLAPASPSAGPACAHDHLGENWVGESVDGPGLRVENTARNLIGIAIEGVTTNEDGWGVHGINEDGGGVLGESTYAIGVKGAGGSIGVYGGSTSGRGVYGKSTSGVGVWGETESSRGVYGKSTSDVGVYGQSTGNTGVAGISTSGVGVWGQSTSSVGVRAQSGSSNLIEAWDSAPSQDLRFYVSNTGGVYADVGYYTPAADMAEMLPAGGRLEPGDVLAVGPDGKLTRSTQPYQASVVGVYSTQPGFVGGAGDDVDLTGKVPLAVAGVVPVKVSAENGPIHPSDLLVASSTPGHAMRAPGEPAPGTVIGKTLGSLDSGTGVIEMLVMLR